MKAILFACLLVSVSAFGQQETKEYTALTKKADACYAKEDFKIAASLYVQAIAANGDMGKVVHRYKAASCYAMTKNLDSAFIQLNRIATKGGFTNVDLLTNDINFVNLYDDPRWLTVVEQVNLNKLKAEKAMRQ